MPTFIVHQLENVNRKLKLIMPPTTNLANKAAISAVFVVSIYVSLNTINIFLTQVAGVGLAAYDGVFLFGLAASVLTLALGRRVIFPKSDAFNLAISVLFMYLIWILVQMLRADHLKGFTYTLLLVRGYFFFIAVVVLCRYPDSLRLINTWVFRVGVAMVLFFTPAYLMVYRGGGSYIPKFEFYENGEYGSLRLEGFAGDPNFYGLYLSLALFCGFSLFRRGGAAINLVRIVLLAGMLLNIAMTISRSILLALLVSGIVFSLLRKINIVSQIKAILISVSSLSLIFFVFAYVRLPILGDAIRQWYVSRSIAATPREHDNMVLWEKFLESPIYGHGLRSSELFLGGYGIFGHNSYLEILVETGLIGLILYLGFYFAVLISGVRAMNREQDLRPWVHMWIMAGFMMPFFSLYQSPYMWMLSGVIIARASWGSRGQQMQPFATLHSTGG